MILYQLTLQTQHWKQKDLLLNPKNPVCLIRKLPIENIFVYQSKHILYLNPYFPIIKHTQGWCFFGSFRSFQQNHFLAQSQLVKHFPKRKTCWKRFPGPNHPWDWYIYLHEWLIFMGSSRSPIDRMGIMNWWRLLFPLSRHVDGLRWFRLENHQNVATIILEARKSQPMTELLMCFQQMDSKKTRKQNNNEKKGIFKRENDSRKWLLVLIIEFV